MIARELVKKDCNLQNIEVVLTRSFAYLDARLIRVNESGKRICDRSGAVAVVALVTSGEIITAHVGEYFSLQPVPHLHAALFFS
jgi:hypothetical protein